MQALKEQKKDTKEVVAIFQYKCDNYYHPDADGGISIADESLGINWQIDPSGALLSEKDLRHPHFKHFVSSFDINTDLYLEELRYCF